MREYLKWGNKKVVGVLVVLFGLSIASYVWAGNLSNGNLKIRFLDVGQGDSILIETPTGKQILVDGGPDSSVVQRLGEFMSFFDHQIDLIVLTHGDADHITGFVDVLRKYKVDQILETGIQCETGVCKAYDEAELAEGAKIIYAKTGQEIYLEDGIGLQVLYPFEDEHAKLFSQRNNYGVVAKLIFPQGSLLLTGDMEDIVEQKLIAAKIDLKSDLLKVAHHGSHSSSTEVFLDAVDPEVAFIEVGRDNRYGHPHQDILERLEKKGIKYYTTKDSGTVTLEIKPDKWEITTEIKN